MSWSWVINSCFVSYKKGGPANKSVLNHLWFSSDVWEQNKTLVLTFWSPKWLGTLHIRPTVFIAGNANVSRSLIIQSANSHFVHLLLYIINWLFERNGTLIRICCISGVCCNIYLHRQMLFWWWQCNTQYVYPLSRVLNPINFTSIWATFLKHENCLLSFSLVSWIWHFINSPLIHETEI